MNKTEKAELLETYQILFAYLSEVFLNEPDEDFIQSILSEKLYFSFPFQSNDANLQKGLNFLQNFSLQWEKPQVYALRDEFLRLFHGTGNMLVPPYESVYLSQDHLMFEKETQQIRKWYSSYGLKIDKLNIIPDDHIGYQLLFIAYLFKLALDAFQSNNTKSFTKIIENSSDFFAKHLLKWVEQFLLQLDKHADSFYFRGNGLILGFLIKEAEKDLKKLSE